MSPGNVFDYLNCIIVREVGNQNTFFMKKYFIAFLLLLAAVFPILFLPLLALTVVIIFFVIPYVAKHGVWGDADKQPKGSI